MKTLSAALQNAITQPVFQVLHLVRIHFDSGTVAWHSGFRDIAYDGLIYRGIGILGSVSPIREAQGIKASGITLTISGIKSEVIALMLSEPYLGRPVYYHQAFVDESLTVDPNKTLLMFRGSVDSIDGALGQSSSFTIEVKSRLADWERPRKLRYTDAEQNKLHPGDKGMEFVAQLSQRRLVWPKASYLPDPRD